MTLRVCQGHPSIASFFSILTSVSRSPSAIAELLVFYSVDTSHTDRHTVTDAIDHLTHADWLPQAWVIKHGKISFILTMVPPRHYSAELSP